MSVSAAPAPGHSASATIPAVTAAKTLTPARCRAFGASHWARFDRTKPEERSVMQPV